MPQMAPIMWDLLLITSFMFSLVLMSKIYFFICLNSQMNQSNKDTIKLKKDNLNWLW